MLFKFRFPFGCTPNNKPHTRTHERLIRLGGNITTLKFIIYLFIYFILNTDSSVLATLSLRILDSNANYTYEINNEVCACLL